MSKEYLEKDFDPNSSTVVQLKSILSANDVHTGHNPKKADLVDAFNQLVKPKIEEIKAKLQDEEDNDDYFNGKVNGNASNSSQNTSSSRRSSVKTRSQVARERSMTPSGYSDDEDVKPKVSPLRNNRTSMLEPSSSRKPQASAKKDADEINPENPFQSYRNKNATASASKTTPSKGATKPRQSALKSASKPVNGEEANGEQKATNQSDEEDDSQHQEPRRSARLQNTSSKSPQHGSGRSHTTPGQQDGSAHNTASSRKSNTPNQPDNIVEEEHDGVKYSKAWSVIRSMLFYSTVAISLALIVFNQYQNLRLSLSNENQPAIKRPTNFWGSEPLSCPPHAYCENGKFIECEPGYKLKEGIFSRQYIPFLYPVCQPHNFEAINVELISNEILRFLDEYQTKLACEDFEGVSEVSLEALHNYISIRFQIHPDQTYYTPLFNRAIQNIAKYESESIILYNKEREAIDPTDPDLLTKVDSVGLQNTSYTISCLVKLAGRRISNYYNEVVQQIKTGGANGGDKTD